MVCWKVAKTVAVHRGSQQGASVEIKILDHLIVTGGDTVSFAERGLV